MQGVVMGIGEELSSYVILAVRIRWPLSKVAPEFPSPSARALLFENISLGISEGERLGLIGPNGAGNPRC